MSRHHTILLASGVAFTTALGLLPSLVVVVAVYGLVASPSDVENHLAGLTDALPENVSELLITELQGVTSISSANITIGLAIGLLGAAYATSSVVNSLVIAIRVAHEQPSPHNWVQGRLFALRLSALGLLSTATMLWLVVVLPPVLRATRLQGSVDAIIDIARWPLVVVTSCGALAVLYRVVADQRGKRLGISAGAVAGTAIWVLSTYGLSLAYDNIDRLQSTFSTLGAVGALLIWLYLSALAALIGAEVDGQLRS
ncbi:MAG: YihY/virulence factor BrkB family protein [Actinomycetia bacterium]|nr:YihY/virulence factor BrkB family protein [Actinomycetes bacterium]MCP4962324.1 YihY/virulence factor BrkB family protein [Actinomycetes bacterium]